MSETIFMKWFLEVTNQEYDGNLKVFRREVDILGGC